MLFPSMPDFDQFQIFSTDAEYWIFRLKVTQFIVQPRDVVLGQAHVDAQLGGGGVGED